MTILLLSHSTGIVGPIDFLENYLLEKNATIFKMQHPLDSYNGKQTILYENKKIIWRKKRIYGGLINIFIDIIISLRFILKKDPDICIGANNVDTLTAVCARIIFRKKIKKIYYFAADFSEKRFGNTLLDKVYIQIEKFVLLHADLTISNTKRAKEKRVLLGLLPKKSMVIPNGVYLRNPVFHKKNIDKHAFIYVGNVTKEHGLVEFLEVIKPSIKKLVVIGQGDEWEALEVFIKDNNIQSFLFKEKSHDFVIDYLQNFSGFGLAPYNMKAKWTYYCSPLKVNEYISCGIPVIISDIPEISQTIVKEKLGIVYENREREEIENNIKKIEVDNFYMKAKSFYERYNFNNLYKDFL